MLHVTFRNSPVQGSSEDVRANRLKLFILVTLVQLHLLRLLPTLDHNKDGP